MDKETTMSHDRVVMPILPKLSKRSVAQRSPSKFRKQSSTRRNRYFTSALR